VRLHGGLFALVVSACGASPAPGPSIANSARSDAAARVESAAAIVEHLRTDLDSVLPRAIANSARCVAVVPGLVHAGLLVGVRGGRGVVVCREQGSWSRPEFFRLSGATAGLTVGVQSADLVMLIMTSAGETALLEGKMQIGADTSVVAGPVGRTAQAATDVALHASIVYYSRSQGLFLGLDFSGTVIERDEEASRAFYGDPRDFGALLRDARPAPSAAGVFRDDVERAFPTLTR
jgi:SH3 domain-containing YSC84-like protein 1